MPCVCVYSCIRMYGMLFQSDILQIETRIGLQIRNCIILYVCVCIYADPYVREDSASLPAIDAALRHIVQEMLSPIDPSIAEKINWTTSMSPAPFKVSEFVCFEVFAAIVCIHPCAYMYVCTDDVQLLHGIFLIYDQCIYSPENRYTNIFSLKKYEVRQRTRLQYMYVCSRNVTVILLYTDDVLQLILQV